jgi:peptidoglycan/LPS O-acetylase OafA/YrhL
MSPTSHLPAATAAETRPPLHIPAINGLRGIAILGVVYVHSVAAIYVQIVGGQWSAATVPVAISPLLTNGSTGVNLFFILSGFVLFLPIVAGNRPLDGIADYLSFYRHRSQRLVVTQFEILTVASR